MKSKALLLALFTAGFAVSIAVAASPAAVEKGKPTVATTTGATTTGATTTFESKRAKAPAARPEGCKPSRKIVVRGTFVAAGPDGFAMTVSGANEAGRPLKGKQTTVLVDAKTQFNGKKRALALLVAGDRLNVQGYACKANVAAGTLLARKVTSKAPKDGDGGTTTTAATTTAVTTTAP